MRCYLTQVVVAAGALSFSLPAIADEPQKHCPPGAWFCADADVSVAPPVQVRPAPAPVPAPAPRLAPSQVVVEEPQEAPEPPPPARVIIRRRPPPPPPAAPPPPVVVYQPVPVAPPPQVIVVTPGYGYGYGSYARPVPAPPRLAPPPAPRWHPEFGLNLRVEGVALGHSSGAAFGAGLGGVGMSLRYRPVPAFAFDLGVDVLAGTDYNGFQRTEVPISLGGMIFLNPKSRVQVYIEGGAHLSRAQVRSDVSSPLLPAQRVDDGAQFGTTYTYFGGQGGGGFEFRLSRRFAVDFDCVGFVRKRIDDGTQPEYIEPGTGRTTNTSGGALFRGGINFWW